MSKRCCGILYPDSEKVCVKCGEPLVDEPDNDAPDGDEVSGEKETLNDNEASDADRIIDGNEEADADDLPDENEAPISEESSTTVLRDEEMGVDNTGDASESAEEDKNREHSDVLISGGDERTDVLTNEPGKRTFHGKTVRDGRQYFEEEERIKEASEQRDEGKKTGSNVVMKILGIISLVALVLFAAGLAYNYYLLFEKNQRPVYEGAAAVGFSSGAAALKDIDMSDAEVTEQDITEEETTEAATEETTEEKTEDTTEAATATDSDKASSTDAE